KGTSQCSEIGEERASVPGRLTLCGSSIVYFDTNCSFLSNKSAPSRGRIVPRLPLPLSLTGNLHEEEASVCLWCCERAGGQQERVEWSGEHSLR
ncbi:uncharacterized, partial [Tachysurus ichikawai]